MGAARTAHPAGTWLTGAGRAFGFSAAGSEYG